MTKENHEDDFQCISRYLLSVFKFAALTDKSILDKEEWLAFSGEDGKWFHALYKKNAENGKAMRQAVDKLFALDGKRKNAIYRAIEHDMRFTEDLAERFEFESIQLEEEEQKLIKDFFLYFYEIVLCTAHFKLQGLSRKMLGRKELAETYFQGENRVLRHVCPVCLQSMTSALTETDVEHYFAKTFVPCLALHPHNLYFICPVCNERYKGSKKQMEGKELDAHKIFLPYMDTVRDKVKVEFRHEKEEDRVQFEPADEEEENIDKKIDAFEELFHLEMRWSGQLELFYDTLYKKYETFPYESMEELEREMLRDLRKGKAVLDSRPDQYIETKYMEWVCRSQLRAFYAEMKQMKQKEP